MSDIFSGESRYINNLGNVASAESRTKSAVADQGWSRLRASETADEKKTKEKTSQVACDAL